MNIPETGTLLEAFDKKDRPLVRLRRTPNGEILTILLRYAGMTEEDKSVVRAAFASATSGVAAGEDGGGVGDIEKFLAFEEERPCG